MHTNYDSIYLSPHLDDAAMSCGGQIAEQTQQGKRVLIVTLMAGDPAMTTLSDYAQSLHSRWELITNATAERRAEDIVACQILGADTAHWQIPDCIYRTHPTTGKPFYVSDDDIFGDVHKEEHGLIDEIAGQIKHLPRCKQYFVPLTVGHHVDHVLTRTATEHCFGTEVYYYEDYPYAQEPGKVDAVIQVDENQWSSEVISISELSLQTKIAAIAAFKSQLSTFFQDEVDLEQQVRGYMNHVGGERIWQRTDK